MGSVKFHKGQRKGVKKRKTRKRTIRVRPHKAGNGKKEKQQRREERDGVFGEEGRVKTEQGNTEGKGGSMAKKGGKVHTVGKFRGGTLPQRGGYLGGVIKGTEGKGRWRARKPKDTQLTGTGKKRPTGEKKASGQVKARGRTGKEKKMLWGSQTAGKMLPEKVPAQEGNTGKRGGEHQSGMVGQSLNHR